MCQPRELIEIVDLIFQLTVQLPQLFVDYDLAVTAHFENEIPHGRLDGFVHFLLQLHFFFRREADGQGFCLFSAQRFLLSHMFFAVASLIRFFWFTFSFRKEKVSGFGLLPDCVREVRRRKAVDIHALCLPQPRTQSAGNKCRRKKRDFAYITYCSFLHIRYMVKASC